MRCFQKDLKYKDVVLLEENKSEGTVFQVVSNVALQSFLPQFLYYYDKNVKVFFEQPNQFIYSNCVADIIFVLLDISYLAPHLYYHFYELSKEEITEEVEKIESYIALLYKKAKDQNSLLLISEFEICKGDITPVGQEDFQLVLMRLNEYMKRSSMNDYRTKVFPMNSFIYEYGSCKFYDKKNNYIMASPYSIFAYNCIAYHMIAEYHFMRQPTKKCLVLDCDNVLWQGILGEDGLEGIVISNQSVGRAYLEFQREIIKLYYQGIIICICSKNNLEDVKNVIQNHPDMLLRDSFISAYEVNYQNKADNIRKLSKELNIALDSMVFIDDSEYERALVQRGLPEVSGIEVDAEKPFLFVEQLRNSHLFYKNQVTDMDGKRGTEYKQMALRRKMQMELTDVEQFHQSLKTNVVIEKVNSYTISRVAEISQRTNQFNLSGRRYTDKELQEMVSDHSRDVLVLRASDIFGDMGIVAVAVIHYKNQTHTQNSFHEDTMIDAVIIEAMYLSCRVFGRNFEVDLLNEIKRISRERHSNQIMGIYKRTEKNQMFSDFYKKHNIIVIED